MKIDVGGRQVEVDNSFSSMTPDQQQATVDEISRSFQMEDAAKAKLAAEATKKAEPVGTFDLSSSQSGIRQNVIDPALAVGGGLLETAKAYPKTAGFVTDLALASLPAAAESVPGVGKVVTAAKYPYRLAQAGLQALQNIGSAGAAAPAAAPAAPIAPAASSIQMPVQSGAGPRPVIPTAAPAAAPAPMTAPAAAPAAAPAQTVQQMALDKLKTLGGLSQRVAPALQTAGAALNAATPASLIAAPYQMAASRVADIQANPNAPQYQYNPRAMAERSAGQMTPGQAGELNRRRAAAGFWNR